MEKPSFKNYKLGNFCQYAEKWKLLSIWSGSNDRKIDLKASKRALLDFNLGTTYDEIFLKLYLVKICKALVILIGLFEWFFSNHMPADRHEYSIL